MSVQEIERAIAELQPAELAELVDWIAQHNANLWDEQIARDIEGGKLDALAEQAIADYRSGKCTPL